jgi:death-on-curing protein
MIHFIPKEVLLVFHEDQLKQYGGINGISDEGLLDSALAQVESSFGGEYLHKTIFEMAAAYGFHICQNHPFYDGNKRTALIAMYIFLNRNGYKIVAKKEVLFALIMDLAQGKVAKQELTEFLESQSIPIQTQTPN